MIPTKQTRFGSLDGNCYAACLATILEKPIEDFDVMRADSGVEWFSEHGVAVRKHGYILIIIKIKDAPCIDLDTTDDILCIASGKSPRGNCAHAVVAKLVKDGKMHKLVMVFDPHPDDEYIEDVQDITLILPMEYTR